MKRLILGAVGLVLLAVAAPALAEPFTIDGKPFPQTVASVNGVKLDAQLLISEVLVYRQMNLQRNQKVSEAKLAEYAHEALSRLVDQQLIFQQTQKLNIKIDPTQIDKSIEQARKQFPSEEMFDTALEMQGLTMDLLKTKFEMQMLEEQYVRKVVAVDIKVSDEEVQAYYQKNLKEFQVPEQYEAHHIFTAALVPGPHDTPLSDPALRKKAERLNKLLDQDAAAQINHVHQQLVEGADFAELAKKNSEDTVTGAKGGSWGPVTLSDFPPAMAEVLKGLKQGEISKPVRSQFGYHILKWTKLIPASHTALSEVKTDIMNALLREKTLAEHSKRVLKLREAADIQLF